MNWIPLNTDSDLEAIITKSKDRPQVIFKHSTRCSISSMVKNRLEKSDQPSEIDFNFLDLLAHRPLSNKVAEQFSVYHESPQVLLIRNGECTYDESHMGISMNEIVEQLRGLGV
jgi:bacillithiol system protein YtxJ